MEEQEEVTAKVLMAMGWKAKYFWDDWTKIYDIMLDIEAGKEDK